MSPSDSALVSIAGQPLPEGIAPSLVSTVIDTSQRLPDCAILRFSDPSRTVLTDAGIAIGSVLKISAAVVGEPAPTPLFDGEITALEAEYGLAGAFTIVRAYDRAHRLHRGRRTLSYLQSTASDIASTVAKRAGLRVGTVTATSTVHDQVSQVEETDWDLLQRLARGVGYEVSVRDGAFCFGPPTDSATAPAAGDDTDPLVLMAGRDLIRWRSVVTSAQQCSTVEVRGWDVATKEAVTATASAATTGATLSATTPAKLAGLFDGPTYLVADVPYRSQAEVDTAAASVAAALAGSFAELEGLARGNPQLVAGQAITLDGLGEPFDGKYSLTSARHHFDAVTGYTTTVTVSGRQDRTLLGLASGGVRTSRESGVVIGKVSDIKDPENRARVRLTFPWLSEDYVSDWARTVQLGAGKDRGLTVLPEVGDEVLVCFEQGDVDRPNVIGGLYNGVDTMPTGAPELIDSGSGAVSRRSWVSRLGHRIDLLDVAGQQEGVRLAIKDDGLMIKLDKTATMITIHADGEVKIEGSKGITVDAGSADLALKGKQISLKATGGVTVDGGTGEVSVKTDSTLALKGMQTSVEGKFTELKGDVTCTVKAATVMIN